MQWQDVRALFHNFKTPYQLLSKGPERHVVLPLMFDIIYARFGYPLLHRDPLLDSDPLSFALNISTDVTSGRTRSYSLYIFQRFTILVAEEDPPSSVTARVVPN